VSGGTKLAIVLLDDEPTYTWAALDRYALTMRIREYL
jgi:hypothetical protein